MKSINVKQVILAFFILCFITINISGSAQADLVDPNIKSAMKIIQLHVQLKQIVNKIDIDKSKYKNKMVYISVSKETAAKTNTKIKEIQKEVDLLCKNLINNQISPNVLLSVTSALRNNIYDIYHVYPFIKCLKTYIVQNNIPDYIKKELIILVQESSVTYRDIDKKIIYRNHSKNPIAAGFVVGLVIGTTLTAAVGQADIANANSVHYNDENNDGNWDSVTIDNYQPYPWEAAYWGF